MLAGCVIRCACTCHSDRDGKRDEKDSQLTASSYSNRGMCSWGQRSDVDLHAIVRKGSKRKYANHSRHTKLAK